MRCVGSIRPARVAALGASVVLLLSVGMVAPPAAAAGLIDLPSHAATTEDVTVTIKAPGVYSAAVDWGDGSTGAAKWWDCGSTVVVGDVTYRGKCGAVSASHAYLSPGDYRVVATLPKGTPLASVVHVTGVARPTPHRVQAQVSFTGLAQMTTTPTPFTVTVSDPNPLCEVEYQNAVQVGGGPHAFVFDVTYPRGVVTVRFCDGGIDYAAIPTTVPFRVGGLRIVNTTPEGGLIRAASWNILDSTSQPATASLERNGVAVASIEVPANGIATLAAKLNPNTIHAGSNRYNLHVQSADGTAMDFPITVTKGWGYVGDTYYGDTEGGASYRPVMPTFVPCSAVPWYFDQRHHPANASRMHRDIANALRLLGKASGLRFVEARDRSDAALVIDWGRLVSFGDAAGLGGPDGPQHGHVHLNPKSFWVANAYSGFRVVNGVPGHNWLIVHETLHAMGLGHTSMTTQIMAPEVTEPAGLGTGDTAGIEFLYDPEQCG